MPYAYINFINPATGRPDQGLPGMEGPVDPGYGIPVPPGIWPKPPGYGGGYPGHPLPNPPGIWGPGSGFPTNPIFIPPLGWVNVPTFPALPIVIPPPGTVNKPGFPSNPIVIPPMPDIDIPEGSALILVITDDGSAWKLVEKSATKPIPMPEPKK